MERESEYDKQTEGHPVYHRLSFAATDIELVARSLCLRQLYILSHYAVFTPHATSRLYITCENSSIFVSIIFKNSFPLRKHNLPPLKHQPVNAITEIFTVCCDMCGTYRHITWSKGVLVNEKAGVSYRYQYDLSMITKTWRCFI